MRKYEVSAMVTISLHKEVEADSKEGAIDLAYDLSMPGLCHSCARAGQDHEDTWETTGELDGEAQEIEVVDGGGIHCDDYIGNPNRPRQLRWFLFCHRLPAPEWILCKDSGVEEPKLWAKYKGEWHRVVMASRFGDVGITKNLDAESGYQRRVAVDELSEFSDVHPWLEF